MNLLYLAHRIPYPPDKGDKIRAFHQLDYLAGRHRVWCVCFVDDPADLRHVEALRTRCAGVVAVPLNRRLATARGLWSLVRGRTVTEGFYTHRGMWSALKKLSREVRFDAVIAFSSSMAPYGLACPADRRMIDFCDWDSAKWSAYATNRRSPRSMLYAVEARRLAAREAQWSSAYDASAIITPAERDAAPPGVDLTRLAVVRNGVSIANRNGNGCRRRDKHRHTVGFLGAMDYPPNVDAVCWFAESTWPAVYRQHPTATFQIAGRHPTPRVQALSRFPGVEVLGAVDSAAEFLHSLTVAVAPLRIARGLQNKVLEAMAAARPVVLTPAAATGIEGTDGIHYHIADEEEATTATVNSLLTDPDRRIVIGRAAREYVAHHFNWEREAARLETLLHAK